MNLRKTIFFLFLLSVISTHSQRKIEADILISNGMVYDGVSNTPAHLDIAINGDKIVFVGVPRSAEIIAKKVVDASGLIVAPGFIDPHTHAGSDLIDPKKSHNKPFLFQGITTAVVGNDGESFFPTSKYRNLYDKQGIGTNALLLVGHGTVRTQVMGKSDKKATKEDIVKMQNLIQQEMDAGAFGMSTGLFYAPGSYSNTDEVIALAKTVAQNNGIYDTHLRDESSFTIGLVPAIEEAIEIGRQAKLPVHISHIKCLGVDVWHQSDSIIRIIESARNEGLDITANQYPYDASATGLKSAVVPRWAESGGKDSLFLRYGNPSLKKRILEETRNNIARRGGAGKLLIVRCDDSSFTGKTLLRISEILRSKPEEAVYDVLKTGYVGVASFNMIPYDITNFMKQPWVLTGSDGNTGHPRKYGSFPRKYHKYVQQEKVIDMATFINNSTSKTADVFRIPKRGRLLEGNYADVIAFDPKTFRDKADYTDAFQLAEGLEYSIINGQLAIEKGKFTEKLNGKVLTK